jgi:hypothetical protein
VHFGHQQIEDDQLRHLGVRQLQTLLAIHPPQHLVTVLFQGGEDEMGRYIVVVGNQNAGFHRLVRI